MLARQRGGDQGRREGEREREGGVAKEGREREGGGGREKGREREGGVERERKGEGRRGRERKGEKEEEQGTEGETPRGVELDQPISATCLFNSPNEVLLLDIFFLQTMGLISHQGIGLNRRTPTPSCWVLPLCSRTASMFFLLCAPVACTIPHSTAPRPWSLLPTLDRSPCSFFVITRR